MQIPLGRVVGSKIRNGETMPTNFTGWLDGDIFILNANEIPYFEYSNGKLSRLGKLKGEEGPQGPKGDSGVTIVDKIMPQEEAETEAASVSALSAKQGYILQTRIDTNRVNHNILRDKVDKQYDENTLYNFSTNPNNGKVNINSSNKKESHTIHCDLNPENDYNTNFAIYDNSAGTLLQTGERIVWNQESNFLIGNGWRYYIIVDKDGYICWACYQPIQGVGNYASHSKYASVTNNPAFEVQGGIIKSVIIPKGGFLIICSTGDSTNASHSEFPTNVNNLASYLTDGKVTVVNGANLNALNQSNAIGDNVRMFGNENLQTIKAFKETNFELKIYLHNIGCSCINGRIFKTIPSFSSNEYTLQSFLSYFPEDGSEIAVNGYYTFNDDLFTSYPIHYAAKETDEDGNICLRITVFNGTKLVTQIDWPDELGIFTDSVI